MKALKPCKKRQMKWQSGQKESMTSPYCQNQIFFQKTVAEKREELAALEQSLENMQESLKQLH